MLVFRCTANFTGQPTPPQYISWEDTISWRAITDKPVETLRRSDMAFILHTAGR